MRRTCLLFLGGLFLLLSACAPNPSDGTEDSRTQIVATTYPVYLFACEVTRGVPDCISPAGQIARGWHRSAEIHLNLLECVGQCG